MVKIYWTYGTESAPEGYEKLVPGNKEEDSVDEILAPGILEKSDNLNFVISSVYTALKPGGKVIFQSPYYLSAEAWQSPNTKRGISEMSLNWASKDWREKAGWKEFDTEVDFDVTYAFATEEIWNLKSDDAKAHAFKHFANAVKGIHIQLTKK